MRLPLAVNEHAARRALCTVQRGTPQPIRQRAARRQGDHPRVFAGMFRRKEHRVQRTLGKSEQEYLFAIHQLIRLALLALWHLPIGYRTTKDWPVVMRNRHHLLVVRFRYMPRMLKRTATVCPTKRNGSWQLALAQLVPDSTAMMIHCFHILRHVT